MKESMRNPHLIEIFVDPETGNFTYKPAVYHQSAKIPPKAAVAWRANGDWALLFAHGSPLTAVGIRGYAEKVVEAPFNPQATPGVYHYAVAVAIGNNVFLDAGCPTIVIG